MVMCESGYGYGRNKSDIRRKSKLKYRKRGTEQKPILTAVCFATTTAVAWSYQIIFLCFVQCHLIRIIDKKKQIKENILKGFAKVKIKNKKLDW